MFATGEGVDRVYVAYNEFKSAIQSTTHRPAGATRSSRPSSKQARRPRTTSTSRRADGLLKNLLLPHYVEIEGLPGACSNRSAAEHAARMTAMDSATNNARRSDRFTDPDDEPGAAGLDHDRDHRGRVRRRGTGVDRPTRTSRKRSEEFSNGQDWQGRSNHRSRRRRRVRRRAPSRRSTTRSTSPDTGAGGEKIDIICRGRAAPRREPVRCVAMVPTDGLVRGMEAEDTGQPIKLPVGKGRSAACST